MRKEKLLLSRQEQASAVLMAGLAPLAVQPRSPLAEAPATKNS
jgi:hypothetical protein